MEGRALQAEGEEAEGKAAESTVRQGWRRENVENNSMVN